ncbi:MAG: LptE family protein [Bacteroidales bacterium]
MDWITDTRKTGLRVGAAISVIVTLLLTSCIIKYSLTGASTTGLKTVSIQYFQNRASLVQPGLSQNLTEALIDKCKSQTNLQLVNGFGDANFEGEIVDYKTVTQTISGDARAAVNRFSIAVKVKFSNSVIPENSYEMTFSRFEDYDSNLDLSQVEGELSVKIIEQLVEDIFNRAFVNW